MCYSLYLVHAPLAAVLGWNLYRWGLDTPAEALLVTVPVVTAASLAVGQLFHRVVERRFLNPPHRPSAPAGAGPAALLGQPVDDDQLPLAADGRQRGRQRAAGHRIGARSRRRVT